MNGYPTFQQVLDGIGDKSVAAFVLSVKRTKADLRAYREAFPHWVADASDRGLANWIHDRLWAHLGSLADRNPDMEIIEKGPTREVTVGINYRFRFKRHDEMGDIASYPTQGFLEFVAQPEQQLPGLEETHLIAGYEWVKDAREIGQPVLSLRDGKDSIIWNEPLPDVADTGEGSGTVPVTPQRPTPAAPTLVIPEGIGRERKEETDPA